MVLAAPIVVTAPAAEASALGCDFVFPVGSAGAAAPWTDSGAVLITGYAGCVPAPDRFHVLLQLQYRPRGGDWDARSDSRSDQIPAPRLNIGTYASTCEPGMWRGAATIWVTKNGNHDQTVTFSNESLVTCP